MPSPYYPHMSRFDWESFGVLDEWSLMAGGRLQEVFAHGGSTVLLGR